MGGQLFEIERKIRIDRVAHRSDNERPGVRRDSSQKSFRLQICRETFRMFLSERPLLRRGI